MDEDEQWIYASISIGVLITVIVYKFTPVASMLQFGEAGQIMFLCGIATVFSLVVLLVGATVKR